MRSGTYVSTGKGKNLVVFFKSISLIPGELSEELS
jgi:hypothetical protein